MFQIQKVVSFILLATLIGACSSDNSSSSANAASLAYSSVNSKLKEVADMIDGSSTKAHHIPTILGGDALGPVWTTNPGVIPLLNTGTSSLKQWMINEFDETFVNDEGAKVTFAGRVSNALDIFCYMAASGQSLDEYNLPPVGSHTLKLTQAMSDACGGGIEEEQIGMSVTLDVAATEDDTFYDRALTFTLPTITMDTPASCPFEMLVRVSDEEINVASSEDQTCDGRDQASLAVFHSNLNTKTSRFKYISKNFSEYPAGFEVYRGFLNEEDDEAYITGFYGGDADGNSANLSGVHYTVVGKPSVGGEIAVSVKSVGNTISDGIYIGCIDNATAAISTDDTLSCDLTGTVAATTWTNVVVGEFNSYTTLNSIYIMSEDVEPGFDDQTNIFN